MDAVFVRDSSSLFPVKKTGKSFYCPTPSKQQPTVSKAAAPPPTDMQWDLKPPSSVLRDTSTQSTSTCTDTSGSSKFNESWPSNSDMAELHTPTLSHTITPTHSHTITPTHSHSMEQSVQPASTLAKYVERFRQAPPTSRGVRSKPTDSFWWKSHSSLTTPTNPPQDQSTPNSKSFTDPSPNVSSHGTSQHERSHDLEQRSHDLLEKSVSLLSSCDSSLPAVKYLNTKRDNNINIHPSLAPPTDPADDILYVWRVKRRLEMARKEAGLGSRVDRSEHVVNRDPQHWSCDMLHCPCDPTGVPDRPCVTSANTTVAVQTTQREGQSTNQQNIKVQSVEVGVQYEATSDSEPLQGASGFHGNESIIETQDKSLPNKERTGCHGIRVLDTSDDDELSLTLQSEPAESSWQPTSTQTPNITPLLTQTVGEHLFKPHPSATPTKEREANISPPIVHPSPDIPWDDHLNDDLLKTLVSRAKFFEAQIREIDLLLSKLDSAD